MQHDGHQILETFFSMSHDINLLPGGDSVPFYKACVKGEGSKPELSK